MDLGGSAFSFDVLGNAVLTNRTSMAVVDRAVYRVLVSKFASGIFDHPYVDESRALGLDPPVRFGHLSTCRKNVTPTVLMARPILFTSELMLGSLCSPTCPCYAGESEDGA
jgi:beta-glucosidase-like glycosyl hydrolase